jgi:hypothetical protein
MADYDTQFSVALPLADTAQVLAAKAILEEWDNGTLDETENEWRSFRFQIEEEDGQTIAWIHDGDGSGSPNDVILFVQLLAERAPTDGRWGFSWAFTCSKPRLDSFAGGAAVIDRTTGECWTIDATEWMHRTIDAPMLPGEKLRMAQAT